MKKITLIMMMGTLAAFIALPSFATSQVQNNDSKKKTATDPCTEAIHCNNLQTAYETESTASARYSAYAEQAENEDRHEIALLFKAISEASGIHAKNTKTVLMDAGQKVPELKPKYTVRKTIDNLKDAIEDEIFEAETMYPEFIVHANKAQHQPAIRSLNYAYLTTHKHKALLEKALSAMKDYNLEPLANRYYVCPDCGNIYETTAPSNCEVSHTASIKFHEISD